MPKITFWPCAGDKAPPVELINELVESNPLSESNYNLVSQTRRLWSTLRRWIAKHQLARPIPSTAMNRTPLWITDVRGLIRRGIPFKDIIHHLHKQFNENISLRTLEFVLNQVIWGFHWFFLLF